MRSIISSGGAARGGGEPARGCAEPGGFFFAFPHFVLDSQKKHDYTKFTLVFQVQLQPGERIPGMGEDDEEEEEEVLGDPLDERTMEQKRAEIRAAVLAQRERYGCLTVVV